jgi:hypothetical protein
MTKPSGAARFEQLPTVAQVQYITVARQITEFATRHALPIVFAPAPGTQGDLDGASGCLIQLSKGIFLLTASHVLAEYENRVKQGEVLNWQVGGLPPFDPLLRIQWRDFELDLVVLQINEEEAPRIGPCAISSFSNWPPRSPKADELVVLAGYPKVLREVDSPANDISAGPYSALFRVTSVGSGYCRCFVERRDLISFNEKALPELDVKIGGLSGGPALLLQKGDYPVLAGIITNLALCPRLI